MRKTLDHQEELAHNGRSEPQQPEETQLLPVAAAVVPPAQVNSSCKMLVVYLISCTLSIYMLYTARCTGNILDNVTS